MIAIPIYNIQLTEQLHTANFTPLLSKEECEEIVKKFTIKSPIVASVDKRIKDMEKRDALVHPIPFNEKSEDLHRLIADRVGRCNMVVYKFNISGIYSDLQLLEYNVGAHYDWHLDIGPGEAAHRKLSVIIQLSDPEDYEGGEVIVNAGTERMIPKDQGQIAIFPSYILHKVTPVTKGKRYALVAWVQSHERFK